MSFVRCHRAVHARDSEREERSKGDHTGAFVLRLEFGNVNIANSFFVLKKTLNCIFQKMLFETNFRERERSELYLIKRHNSLFVFKIEMI